MLVKIYLLLLAICSAILAALTYLSWGWLQSIGAPTATVEGYSSYALIAGAFLGVSSVVLLILANIILISSRRSWALWATLIYFVLFTVVRYFWLERSLFYYMRDTGMTDGMFPWSPVIGVGVCLGAASFAIIDYFVVTKVTNKVSPEDQPAEIEVIDPEES